MQHPDEGTIHTWLDGELPADDAAEMEAHVAECSECAASVAEARGFIAGSSRIVSALDIVPGDVIPIAAPLAIPRKRNWHNNTQFRAAAAVLFVAGASILLLRDGREAKVATVMDRRAAETAPIDAPTAQPMVAEENARALKVADQAKDETTAAKAVESQLDRQSARSEKRTANSTAVAQSAPEAGSTIAATGTAKESAEHDKRRFNDGQIAGASAATAKVAASPPAPRPLPATLERMRASVSNGQMSNVIVTGVAEAPAPAAAAAPPPVAPLRLVRADTAGTRVRTTFEVSPGVEVTLTETRVADASAVSTQQRQVAVPLSKTSASSPSPSAPSGPVAYIFGVESVSWVSTVSGRSYVLSGPLTKEQLTVLRSRFPAATR